MLRVFFCDKRRHDNSPNPRPAGLTPPPMGCVVPSAAPAPEEEDFNMDVDDMLPGM